MSDESDGLVKSSSSDLSSSTGLTWEEITSRADAVIYQQYHFNNASQNYCDLVAFFTQDLQYEGPDCMAHLQVVSNDRIRMVVDTLNVDILCIIYLGNLLELIRGE